MATIPELRVLILEDVAADAELMVRALQRAGIMPVVKRVDGREAFTEALDHFTPDIVLLDFSLPHFDGKSAIQLARRAHPEIPLIIVTGTLPDEPAIELLRLGAADYVLKSNLVRLPTAVRRALVDERRIRKHRRAEQALREAHALLSKVTDTSPVGITVWGTDGTITFANPEAVRLLDRGEEERSSLAYNASAWQITDFIGNAIADEALPYRKVMNSGQPVREMKMAIAVRNGRRKLSINAAPLRTGLGEINGVVATLEDVTQREAAAETLRSREEHLRLAMAAAIMGTWTVELANLKVSHSVETAAILGLPPGAQFSSMDEFLAQVHPDDREDISNRLRNAIVSDGYGVDFRAVWPDGSVHWINGKGNVIRDASGKPLKMLGVLWDISLRKENEIALDHANRALRVLSAVNQQLIHAHDEQSLVNAVCRVIVETGGYRLAWVGAPQHDEQKSVLPLAHHGDDGDFFALAKVSWAEDDTRGQGPTGTAIRTGTMQVVRDITSDPRTHSWRDDARERGYRSSIAFPLHDATGVFGSLTIYAPKDDAFNDDEIRLLQELADDLAFGVVGLRRAVEQRRTEDMLRLHDRAIAESINGIVISKACAEEDNPIIYANPAFMGMTGYTADELIGCNPRILLNGDLDQPDVERLRDAVRHGRDIRAVLRNYRKDGSLFWNEISMASVHDESGLATHFISVFNDITEHMRYQAELAHQANHDALTGLANRNLLQNRIEHALVRAARNGTAAAVLFIDLDHFKYVNDSLGHAVGDQLIKAVGEQLSACAREADTVARVSGDEFVVLLADLLVDTDVINVLTRVLATVCGQYQIERHEMYVTASIGVSLYPRDGQNGDVLLRNADAAMYRAKETGRHRFEFFQEAMNERASERLFLETGMRHALERGELRVHYQPQVDLHTGAILGAEALVRWQHPELGLILPGQFIPVAEETGLILLIGEWVLKSVCKQVRLWLDAGLSVPRVAVNLSARQFRQKNLAQMIAETLASCELDAKMLEVEIVESAALGDVDEAVAIMQELKSLGIKISMDDFGTGYSSLSSLRRFPIDSLKIDRDFVRELTSDPDAAAICLTTITLAHSMRLTVIAEGVETEGQLNYLLQHRCDAIQGYYFSRPLSPDDFGSLLSEEKKLMLPAPESGMRRRTLLIVDDEANIRSALKRLLRSEGYDILTAASALEGLELLATHEVQVIISDQRMPGMTGVEFLRRAKSLYPDTVRLVLSGFTELQSVTDAVNEGAIYKFLTKPWDDTQLRAHVEEAFRRKEMVDDNYRLNLELRTARQALAATSQQLEDVLKQRPSLIRT